MVDPELANGLQILKSMVIEVGSGTDIADLNKVIASFQANEDLTIAEKKSLNAMHKRLKKASKIKNVGDAIDFEKDQ